MKLEYLECDEDEIWDWECLDCGEVWQDELPPIECPYCDSTQIQPVNG